MEDHAALGGWSDAPIESWHSLVGAFNYQRSQFPRNQVRLLYADDGGHRLRHPHGENWLPAI